jgi:hypothetical protein
MSDHSMPDYDSEPSEWESNQTVKFPRHIEVQMKAFRGRIQLSHTVQALLAIRHDIERGSLANNAPAKDELKRLSNQKAREIGFKDGQWWN